MNEEYPETVPMVVIMAIIWNSADRAAEILITVLYWVDVGSGTVG